MTEMDKLRNEFEGGRKLTLTDVRLSLTHIPPAKLSMMLNYLLRRNYLKRNKTSSKSRGRSMVWEYERVQDEA